MNQKANEALIATILQRWTATSNPSAGTTAVASVAATPKVRHTLGIITASQKNQTAGAVTASLKVTADSIAGTVLAQQHFLTAAAGVERFGFEFALPAPLNTGIVVSFDTVQASVSQTITMTGYSESFS